MRMASANRRGSFVHAFGLRDDQLGEEANQKEQQAGDDQEQPEDEHRALLRIERENAIRAAKGLPPLTPGQKEDREKNFMNTERVKVGRPGKGNAAKGSFIDEALALSAPAEPTDTIRARAALNAARDRGCLVFMGFSCFGVVLNSGSCCLIPAVWS